MTFTKTALMYVPFEKRFDQDGKVWLKVQAHGNLTALTPYKVIVNEFGYVTAALADDEYYFYVGVPPYAISSGEIDWVQIGGPCSGMVVAALTMAVGNAVKMYDGVVTDTTADYTGGVGEFAVVYTATTGADDVLDVILVPERIRQASS